MDGETSRDLTRVRPPGRWVMTLVEASPTPMGVISTLENRYVCANAALAELYGISLAELIETDPFSLAGRISHADDLPAEQALFAELISGARRSYQVEKRFLRPDGTERWGVLTMAGLYEPSVDPTMPGVVIIGATIQVVDTTARKALEKTLIRREAELHHAQRVDALGRLSAGIAHDFNNLLTVITGHGQALQHTLKRSSESASSADVEGDVEAILTAAERAAGLTAQLLAHGRRGPVAPRPLSLSDLTASLGKMLSRTLGEDVVLSQTLDAKGAIFADEGQIGQVVMNLVLNARDALPDRGHIRIETRDVTVGRNDTAVGLGVGDWVLLLVSDDGHGMTPEVQARMFEAFFTTRTNRAGIQGNGLGLATVHRIVTEAAGHIQVDSARERGTTMKIYFPRVAPRAEMPKALAAPRVRIPPNSGRVLVVEDEPMVRSLVATVLLGAQYHVSVARHGEEALAMLARDPQPFHLVVTDLMMPKMNGVELAEALMKRGDAPRMLFISGYGDHSMEELEVFGKLLRKPFTPAQLLDTVAETLEGAALNEFY